MIGYIYLITNTINGHLYIGQHITNNMDDGYKGSGILLHKAYKKYGIDFFTKEILFYTTSKSKKNLKTILNPLETLYIKRYNTFKQGYNLTTGGDSYLLSNEIKKKISDANKGDKHPLYGKHHSEETKKRMSEQAIERFKENNHPWYGRHHTEETKKKISEAKKGKKRQPFSDETRQKMSEAGKGKHNHKGENNPNYKGGKKEKVYVPKDVWKLHISNSKKGCTSWNTGKHWGEETKNKLSLVHIGTHRVYDNVEHTKWHMEKNNEKK